jgi:hypothetical protein
MSTRRKLFSFIAGLGSAATARAQAHKRKPNNGECPVCGHQHKTDITRAYKGKNYEPRKAFHGQHMKRCEHCSVTFFMDVSPDLDHPEPIVVD